MRHQERKRPPHPGEDRCPGCQQRIVDAGGEAPTALYLDKQGKVTDAGGTWVCSSCIDSGFEFEAAARGWGRTQAGAEAVRAAVESGRSVKIVGATRTLSPADLRLHIELARANLENWREPHGGLVATEPDPETRARIRISLRGFISGLLLASGETSPPRGFEDDDHRDLQRIRDAAVAGEGREVARIAAKKPPQDGTRAAYMAIPGVRQVVEVAPGRLRVLADHEVSEVESSPEQRLRELEEAEAEIRRELEEVIGRTPDPARSTVQLAREVAGITEHRRIDAEHYRSEAARVSELEISLTGLLHRETGLQVDLDAAKAENRSLRAKLAAATLGGTDADRLRDLEAAARDARDWIVEALDTMRAAADVPAAVEVLRQAHKRLEAMNLGDGDPDAKAGDHAHPDDSAGADEGRVAALERAIVEAVGILACHDLHGDETALAARQAFEGLGIPGLAMVTRCASCAEPIEEETETCPDCKLSLLNNLVSGLEAIGPEEGDDDA